MLTNKIFKKSSLFLIILILVSTLFITCSENSSNNNKYENFYEKLEENRKEISHLAKKLNIVDISFSDTKSVNFTLEDLKGNDVKLSEVYGKGKVVILNFWAIWCKYCIIEKPLLESLYQKMKTNNTSNIEILAVHTDPRYSKDDVIKFAEEKDYNFTILYDKTKRVSNSYIKGGIPMSYIVAPDGKLLFAVMGMLDWSKDDAEKFINLLNSFLTE